MLGVALNAQRAGWGSTDPQASIKVNTVVAGSMSYPNSRSIPSTNGWNSPDQNNLSGVSFDSSGVVSGNRVVTAKTFRIGEESSYTWRDNPFGPPGWQFLAPRDTEESYSPIFFYLSQPDSQFTPTGNPKIARRSDNNRVAFLCEWGNYQNITMTGNYTWSDFEDRWVTVIYSASTNANDFANFESTTGNFGNLYQRLVLVDTETGELLSKTDARDNQFQAPNTNFADQTITYADSQLASEDSWLFTQVRSVDLGDTTYMGSGWLALGETVDTMAITDGVPNYQYFCGNYLPETIAGVRAWINVTPESDTADGSNASILRMGKCRVTTTDSIFVTMSTGQVSSPYTSTIIP